MILYEIRFRFETLLKADIKLEPNFITLQKSRLIFRIRKKLTL